MIRHCLLTLLAAVGSPLLAAAAAEPAKVDYNRQVRPILSDKCYKCHGPDAAERQAGFRLDDRASATGKAESGETPIVPGKPEASELVTRITSDDESVRMPPADAPKKLTAEEIELLKRWVAQGADFQQHWAFVPPTRAALPLVQTAAWVRQPVDLFILARLESERLQPSPEAERTTLIRRLNLDLTGLPPTIDEVDAVARDASPDAYERLVDRLQASPFYGERMALDWLDAARFADTHGYHIDSGRDMTRWREYVIEAFNRNLPYDRFTLEQIAGDLLPETPDSQENLRRKIASGFQRNNMINFEGGAIPQEYLNAYIVDRVNTLGTVFLGMTVACTQCHDHKYDPMTQKDFYQLYAFFNTIPENGLDGSKGNAVPLIRAPRETEKQRLASLNEQVASLEKQLSGPLPEVDAAQAKWEPTAIAEAKADWLVPEPAEFVSQGGATLKLLADRSLLASGTNPEKDTYEVTLPLDVGKLAAVRLEALADDSFPHKGPGRSANGNVVLTSVKLALASADGASSPLMIKSAEATFAQREFTVASAIDADPEGGWAIFPEVGKSHAAMFMLNAPVELAAPARLKVTLEFQSIYRQHQFGRFRLGVTSQPSARLTGKYPAEIAMILGLPADQRSSGQTEVLRKYYRETISPDVKQLGEALAAAKKQRDELDRAVPTVMVMEEMQQPRETFVLLRGAYDKPGEKVAPNVPGFLPPLPESAPRNRLSLAQWLTSPDHPLMARVTVNRYWQLLFGTGLVKTAEDFGSQGERPSHGDLLNWLAVEFRGQESDAAYPQSANRNPQSNWDVKRLIRKLATSAAYRQSSVVSPALVARDPENRLLARGPRFRLSAEFIRDQALAAAGLLNREIGGKSVSPYQPAGLWEELMSREDGKNWTAQSYEQDHGKELYRRTMYTFWKRTCPPPTLTTFDAPDRETCTVRRARTNTPLQALVLMNDPTYVEASRKFAERILSEGGSSLDSRLTFAFRTVLTRAPREAELAVLRQVYEKQKSRFAASPDAAEKLLSVGESPRDASLDHAELAAWTMVASTLLNLDEAVTKG
jgi:mono/diheme cytochrome c family protein